MVIHLGTNGILIQAGGLQQDLRGRGSEPHRLPRHAEDPALVPLVKRRLAACAERRANTQLINWYRFSHDHPSWFAADGYHLTPRGQAKYAAFIGSQTA